MEAECECRWVLPGVCPCSPFEEGLPHAWMGGLVPTHRVGGEGWGGRGAPNRHPRTRGCAMRLSKCAGGHCRVHARRAPVEEGIPHVRMGGGVVHSLGWG